jgi:oxygen-independent coproporphyrinogen-3 oxidase
MNIDLMYGLPNLTLRGWEKNLGTFLSLQVPHLSAYHLTIEPKTVLGYHKRMGRMTEIDEKESVAHYSSLVNIMKTNGYLHYEISNFCTEGNFSKHNTNYWKQGTYLGLGPSAHSYNGQSRQWNVSVNNRYIESIEKDLPYYETEHLTEKEHFNDYLLTHLRTIWGVNFEDIRSQFGEAFITHFRKELQKYSSSPFLKISEKGVSLTEQGMFVSDRMISEFFFV